MNRINLTTSSNFSKHLKSSPYTSTFTKTAKLRLSQPAFNKENIAFNTKSNPVQSSHAQRNNTHQRRLSLTISNKENNPKAVNNHNTNKNNTQKRPVLIKYRSKSVTKECFGDLKSPLESEIRQLQPKYESPQKSQEQTTNDDNDDEIDVQLGNIKKSISDQEKALQNLKIQIELEKSTISQLGRRASQELAEFEGPEDAFHSDQLNTIPLSTHQETSKDLEDIRIDTSGSATIKRNLKFDSKIREETFGANCSCTEESRAVHPFSNELVAKNQRRSSEIQYTEIVNTNSMKELLAENHTLANQVENYRKLLTATQEKHDTEIQVLKKSIETLTQENFKLRFEIKVKTEDSQKNEEMLRDKLLSLEEELRKNTDSKQTAAMRERMDIMTKKMVKLQAELEKNTELEERIKELTQQVSFKENELFVIKKNFSEMYLEKTDEQAKQKKEWAKIYRELLNEIRLLKAEIDSMHKNNRSQSRSPCSYYQSNDCDEYD